MYLTSLTHRAHDGEPGDSQTPDSPVKCCVEGHQHGVHFVTRPEGVHSEQSHRRAEYRQQPSHSQGSLNHKLVSTISPTYYVPQRNFDRAVLFPEKKSETETETEEEEREVSYGMQGFSWRMFLLSRRV